MVVCAGCASKETPSHVAGPPMPAAAAAAEPRPPRVAVEDDGLPVQLAPRNRASTPDDPREPWSPNYGSVPMRASEPPVDAKPEKAFAPAAAPSVTKPKRASQSSGNQRQFDDFDADDVVRRAIAEHEMRQQR
jgi:hypothetical protein